MLGIGRKNTIFDGTLGHSLGSNICFATLLDSEPGPSQVTRHLATYRVKEGNVQGLVFFYFFQYEMDQMD